MFVFVPQGHWEHPAREGRGLCLILVLSLKYQLHTSVSLSISTGNSTTGSIGKIVMLSHCGLVYPVWYWLINISKCVASPDLRIFGVQNTKKANLCPMRIFSWMWKAERTDMKGH
jgi:hypothetical protein